MKPYVRKLAPLDPCPVEAAVAVVAGKWKARILYFLAAGGPQRFGELRRLLPPVRQQVLAAQLRQLEDDGIVRRADVSHRSSPASEYRLSAQGESLLPVLDVLAGWGQTRIGPWQPPLAQRTLPFSKAQHPTPGAARPGREPRRRPRRVQPSSPDTASPAPGSGAAASCGSANP